MSVRLRASGEKSRRTLYISGDGSFALCFWRGSLNRDVLPNPCYLTIALVFEAGFVLR